MPCMAGFPGRMGPVGSGWNGLPDATFDFTSSGASVPSGWTFSRSDAISTYRDSAGKMRVTTANAPRFNYTIAGVALGMRMEGTRKNYCTNFNMLPVALTNITDSGTAVTSLVADATALTAFNVETVVTGNVYETSGGIAGGTVVIGGTTGATGVYCVQIVARHTVGSGATFGITPSPTAGAITGTAYNTFYADRVTSTATTDTMVITIPANVTIRWILNQMELGPFSSSVIKIAGAVGTRSNENLSCQSIQNQTTYFNIAQGTIVADLSFDNLSNTTAIGDMIVLCDTGNGTFTDFWRLYRVAATTRRKNNAQYFAQSVNQATGKAFAADVGSIDAQGQRYCGTVSWQDGVNATVSTGSNNYFQNTLANAFTSSSIVHLYIGNRAGVEQVFGHVRGITMFKRYLPPETIGRFMVKSGEYLISTCGQSNMTDWFAAQSGANNTGEISGKAVIDAFWPSTRNYLVNSGTAGTSVKYYSGTSTDADYWLNTTTGEKGAPFRRWVSMNTGCLNGTFQGIIDTSGESDAGNCTVQEFVDAQIAKFTIMRSIIGNVPVFIVPIGRNTGAQDGYQTIREAMWQLVGAQNPGWIYRCPERFDLALSDSIHMTDTSAGTCATRTTRKLVKVLGSGITGDIDGPAITNVTRIGTAVTVTLAHDAGTDFTPTTAIAGFHYYNGSDYLATENVILAAVRTNATTITLTLTSSSAGTLYYGKGSLSTDTIANLVIDNSAQALPLKSSKWTVT